MNTTTTTTNETADSLEVQLRQYLIGFGKRDGIALSNMKNTRHWSEMAQLERQKRCTRFLEVLPDDIVQAIAAGQIDFLKEVEIVEGSFAPVQAIEEPTEALMAAFTTIAKRHLLIETLETRGSDSLDFHDVGVAGVRKALTDAYNLGARSL